MSGRFDATCPSCRKRYSWIGTLKDKPPCPKCGWAQDPFVLARESEDLERTMQHMRECEKSAECPICTGRTKQATVGDKGQRYEVVQVRDDGTTMTWGWTDKHDGGTLANAVKLHPCTKCVQVRDRVDGGLANEIWPKGRAS